MAKFTGEVKWFNNAKGFGFVGCGDGPDVFCHYSSILTNGYKTLKEGEKVEYDVIQGEKGPQTDQVRRVGVPVIDAPAAAVPFEPVMAGGAAAEPDVMTA